MTVRTGWLIRSGSRRAPAAWRGWARSSLIGGWRWCAPAVERISERIQSIFDDVDVVVTPGTAAGPSRVGAYQHRGAVSTLLLVAQKVPYFPVWNMTGQPAAVVPWGLDGDGPAVLGSAGRPAV